MLAGRDPDGDLGKRPQRALDGKWADTSPSRHWGPGRAAGRRPPLLRPDPIRRGEGGSDRDGVHPDGARSKPERAIRAAYCVVAAWIAARLPAVRQAARTRAMASCISGSWRSWPAPNPSDRPRSPGPTNRPSSPPVATMASHCCSPSRVSIIAKIRACSAAANASEPGRVDAGQADQGCCAVRRYGADRVHRRGTVEQAVLQVEGDGLGDAAGGDHLGQVGVGDGQPGVARRPAGRPRLADRKRRRVPQGSWPVGHG